MTATPVIGTPEHINSPEAVVYSACFLALHRFDVDPPKNTAKHRMMTYKGKKYMGTDMANIVIKKKNS